MIHQWRGLWCHMAYKILYISTCAWPMTTKHSMVSDTTQEASPINSHSSLNMCLHEAMWQIKSNACGHKMCQGCDLLQRVPHPYICMTPQWSGHVRCRDKLNTLYLHGRKSMDTKLGTLLSYRERLPPLSHLTLWLCYQSEITNILISTVKILMATKHGRVLTNGRRLYMQSLKSSSTSCFRSY